jgi:hypothetical protein
VVDTEYPTGETAAVSKVELFEQMVGLAAVAVTENACE